MPASSDSLRVEESGAVTTLVMNRPDRRNALSPELDAALRQAFTELADDASVRAVVLTGAGPSFCAGADLKALGNIEDPDDVYDHLITRYLPLIEAITSLPKPVLAAVNGTASGAGCALALACDLRIMAEDAALAVAFSNVGLVPDMATSWFLVRQLGYARAYELAAEGRALPAEDCLELGLVNRVTPGSNLREAVQEWAQTLARRPTRILGLTKKAFYEAAHLSLSDAAQREAELQREAAATDDHREGVQAFLEKRSPDFRGT